MKLAHLNTDTGPRIVAISGDDSSPGFLDLTAIDPTLPPHLKELLSQSDGLDRAQAAAEKAAQQNRYTQGTLGPPIPRPGKIICIGLNYRDHAEETNSPIPEEPVCFGKFGNTIIGPEETIRLPQVSHQVDFEAELVVVIGREGYRIAREEAFGHVAGYMNGHDVSARDWQKGRPGGQWLLGKTPDTFAPIGPWLVTSDEIADPHALSVQLRLNGELMQDGNTSELIFGIDQLIAHLSQIMTLSPGDLIFTGTPAGVGMGRTPPVFLQPGDEVEVQITGLGKLRNRVESSEAYH